VTNGNPGRRQELEAKTKEEEEMAARVEERVRARVEEAMASDEVQKQIAARLKEERAQLEQKVPLPIILKVGAAELLSCFCSCQNTESPGKHERG
jgi:Arginine and glutamate-rich 1